MAYDDNIVMFRSRAPWKLVWVAIAAAIFLTWRTTQGQVKTADQNRPAAARESERARGRDPRLAAPHFQLFGLYRQMDRAADSAAELKRFQELKKSQEGAAVPEDVEWSYYAEIYDPIDSASAAQIS